MTTPEVSCTAVAMKTTLNGPAPCVPSPSSDLQECGHSIFFKYFLDTLSSGPHYKLLFGVPLASTCYTVPSGQGPCAFLHISHVTNRFSMRTVGSDRGSLVRSRGECRVQRELDKCPWKDPKHMFAVFFSSVPWWCSSSPLHQLSSRGSQS